MEDYIQQKSNIMNRKQLWLLGTGMILLLSSVFIFKSLEEKSFESRSSRYLSERKKKSKKVIMPIEIGIQVEL